MYKKLLIVSILFLITSCSGISKNDDARLMAELNFNEANTVVDKAKSYKLNMNEADKKLSQARKLLSDEKYKDSNSYSKSAKKLATEAISNYEQKQDEITQAKIEATKQAKAEAKRLAEEDRLKAEASQRYIVQSGDNLWSIAESNGILEFDALSWPLIYKNNQSVIDDPDLIQPDMVLIIEPATEPNQLIKARRHARSRGIWKIDMIEDTDRIYLQ